MKKLYMVAFDIERKFSHSRIERVVNSNDPLIGHWVTASCMKVPLETVTYDESKLVVNKEKNKLLYILTFDEKLFKKLSKPTYKLKF